MINDLNSHLSDEENSVRSKGAYVYDKAGKDKKKVTVKNMTKSFRKGFQSWGGFHSEGMLEKKRTGMSLASCYKYKQRYLFTPLFQNIHLCD